MTLHPFGYSARSAAHGSILVARRAGSHAASSPTAISSSVTIPIGTCSMISANMPTTPEGVDVFLRAKILYGPGKAANAGGVAVSGLEMAQNSMRFNWQRSEVDDRLRVICKSIHAACVTTANRFSTPGNYVNGANIAGFLKVAKPMVAMGLI